MASGDQFVDIDLHPGGATGEQARRQRSMKHSVLVHLQTFSRPFYNTTTTTKQSTTKTNSKTQATATGTPRSIDPVAIATCLGVLENACATNNSQTTFGQCDSLFVFFYCDLTDMMVFRGAMKLDADGMSPVCQPTKKFCSRAIPLNRIPLPDVSP
ncbi:hypothetical protein BCON_0033g00060 [Botryotinia convoluta]|uniref:Uncharacterized protein n=1 Tax=Botryotinia convoluta TaxID=54673 RepID=A0A4Z1IJM5_9HELO|nr:hypothetical protein BCON_0033g00060 [Botryotinia convoluta]